MLSFGALNIVVVPRDQNWEADRLAIQASTFQPIEQLMDGKGKYEVNFRPSIPDNITHWQVFDDDKQVLNFIHNVQEFKDCQISYIEEGEEDIEIGEFTENPSPGSVVALEQIFDKSDMMKENKKESIKPVTHQIVPGRYVKRASKAC